MFARIFALLPLALLVSAHHKARQSSSQCDTGTIQCCTTTQPVSEAGSILEPYGLASILDGDSIVGTGCSSTGLVGVGGGANCQQQPVCCNGNTFDGLVSIGCSPINVGL